MPATPVRLADHAPCPFCIDRADLVFELDPADTLVTARLSIRRTGPAGADLVLDGADLALESLSLDGRALAPPEYDLTETTLRIPGCPDAFELELRNRVNPAANTRLEGLYASGPLLCTQCEPEGFRRITYFLDRPDNLSLFTVRLIADAQAFPVLLSNGNPVDAGPLPDGRHFTDWEDPFPKPSYLFALVAGTLVPVEDVHVTGSGRPISCRVWVEPHNRDRADHALGSLLTAMAWDERAFHRECDLDLYQVVAVDAFNAGAMENKGLNIFNSRYVLASPETATDADYDNILRVIGHEYFHNWSGNRVTLRDWFQLSLKEGLTVFRDQEFTCDTLSRGVKRVADARLIRTEQFLEDAGPLAHPVRPEAYVDINNFYTRTVYEKGAELIRMMQTWIGQEAFVAGIDLYFARHDGSAATVEDLIAALGEAAGANLSAFLRWYAQPGTPLLRASCACVDGAAAVVLSQENPRAGADALPLPMPVVVGFVAPDGAPVTFADPTVVCVDEARRLALLRLTERGQAYRLPGVPAGATPCWLGGFSAPVRLEAPDDVPSMLRRAAHAPDPYNRWDANTRLMLTLLRLELERPGAAAAADSPFARHTEATRARLDDDDDPAFGALLLSWPGELACCQDLCPEHELGRVLETRDALTREAGARLAAALHERFTALHAALPPLWGLELSGRRAWKNALFHLWARQGGEAVRALAATWYAGATNMTDRLAALAVLCREADDAREAALRDFLDRFGDDFTMLTTWFAVQASAGAPDTFDRVRVLLAHPAFDWANPNKVRAVLRTFAANLRHFHRPDGAGYAFLADAVLRLNGLNPHLASGLVGAFSQTGLLDPARLSLVRDALDGLARTPGLHAQVLEQVNRILG